MSRRDRERRRARRVPAAIQQSSQAEATARARAGFPRPNIAYVMAFSLGILAMFFSAAWEPLAVVVLGIGILGTSLGLGRAVGLLLADRRRR